MDISSFAVYAAVLESSATPVAKLFLCQDTSHWHAEALGSKAGPVGKLLLRRDTAHCYAAALEAEDETNRIVVN